MKKYLLSLLTLIAILYNLFAVETKIEEISLVQFSEQYLMDYQIINDLNFNNIVNHDFADITGEFIIAEQIGKRKFKFLYYDNQGNCIWEKVSAYNPYLVSASLSKNGELVIIRENISPNDISCINRVFSNQGELLYEDIKSSKYQYYPSPYGDYFYAEKSIAMDGNEKKINIFDKHGRRLKSSSKENISNITIRFIDDSNLIMFIAFSDRKSIDIEYYEIHDFYLEKQWTYVIETGYNQNFQNFSINFHSGCKINENYIVFDAGKEGLIVLDHNGNCITKFEGSSFDFDLFSKDYLLINYDNIMLNDLIFLTKIDSSFTKKIKIDFDFRSTIDNSLILEHQDILITKLSTNNSLITNLVKNNFYSIKYLVYSQQIHKQSFFYFISKNKIVVYNKRGKK